MRGQHNPLDLKFAAGKNEVTGKNHVVYGATDTTMTGVHDYNSAQQVVDFPDMPDLIGVDSDDRSDDFILPSLTELMVVQVWELMIVMIVKPGVLPV